ncbi:DUF3667 domain-containing protein [bacterium]|nr:DUF3667 domain-containing protein [bacterium]
MPPIRNPGEQRQWQSFSSFILQSGHTTLAGSGLHTPREVGFMAESDDRSDRKSERSFVRELFDEAFDLQHGLWKTFLTLFRNPQVVVRSYNDDAKANYYSPVKYVLLATALLTFILYTVFDYAAVLEQEVETHLQNGTTEEVAEHRMYAEQITDIFNRLSNDYSSLSTLFLRLPCLALFSFLFFRRIIPRFSHHLALNAYLTGQAHLISSVLLLPVLFLPAAALHGSIYIDVVMVMVFFYYWYAYIRLFGHRSIGGWIASGAGLLLAYTLYLLLLITISTVAAIVIAGR